jgi:hypothetical protein
MKACHLLDRDRQPPGLVPARYPQNYWQANAWSFRIPTGFRLIAHGCAPRATMGKDGLTFQPQRGCVLTNLVLCRKIWSAWGRTRGVGFEVGIEARGHNPVGVDHSMGPFPRVARSAQPWAVVRNPVGILRQMQGKPICGPILWVMSWA